MDLLETHKSASILVPSPLPWGDVPIPLGAQRYVLIEQIEVFEIPCIVFILVALSGALPLLGDGVGLLLLHLLGLVPFLDGRGVPSLG